MREQCIVKFGFKYTRVDKYVVTKNEKMWGIVRIRADVPRGKQTNSPPGFGWAVVFVLGYSRNILACISNR